MPIWAITIPELNVYEQREVVDTAQAQGVAALIAMQYRCTPDINAPWSTSAPWGYKRKVRLPDLLVPERELHQKHKGLRGTIRCKRGKERCEDCACKRGLACLHCDDRIQMLNIAGGESLEIHMAMPIRTPGRRTLLERNRLGEFGTLEVALVFDLMMGVKPDPQAVSDWEAAGGANAPGANAARETALYEKS